MDIVKGRLGKSLMIKVWKRCNIANQLRKKNLLLAPAGCFSVYVGPEKKRFVVKVELANHPLFKLLLEDAAWEYGYSSGGPILLPCDVEWFYNALAEMEYSLEKEIRMISSSHTKSVSLIPCSHNSSMNKGYVGAYRLLTPTLAYVKPASCKLS